MKKSPRTTANIRLRELKPGEIPSIFPLVHMHNPQITRARFDANLKDMLPHGYKAIAAFDGEQMIGVSGFWLRSRFWCGRQLDIDNFFIHPDYRRHGIGTRMVQWLEKRAAKENCQLIVLDTYADSFLAHRFYHREGFVSTGFHMTKVPGTNEPFTKLK